MTMKIAVKTRAFLKAKRGNVAMMFAIAMVPMTLAAGAGLDFARAMLVRQQMTGALDAAALAVGSTTGLDQTAAQHRERNQEGDRPEAGHGALACRLSAGFAATDVDSLALVDETASAGASMNTSISSPS